MPARTHEDQAAKQRAYRQRQKALAAARASAGVTAAARPAPTPALQYRKWRTTVTEAYSLLEATYESINEWKQERSERWHDSDTASELEADYAQLETILEELAGLSRLAPLS